MQISDNNDANNMETSTATTAGTTSSDISELVRIVHSHLNPVPFTSSTTSSMRTFTPPLMGTFARAAKRRIDIDSRPIRIEGTDTYNQQLKHYYQNIHQISKNHQLQTSNDDTSSDAPQSFNAKREFFEQCFKPSSSTYDSPPRQQQQQPQKISSAITAAASNFHDRTSSSSNESPSVDRLLKQAVELQKLSSTNSIKTDSQAPSAIERTEEYQTVLDSLNHEVRRTPIISHMSIVSSTKAARATDLDQAQAQVERLTDDHQAIQQLTRAIQEHNATTIGEYKRLLSKTNTNSFSSPPMTSEVPLDRTNLLETREFSVIDALVSNPLGANDEKRNNLLRIRYNDIMTNLRNPEYVDSLKQSITANKESKKRKTEKKPKSQALLPMNPAEQISVPSHITTLEPIPAQTTELITATSLSERIPLIDPKQAKKHAKNNKKETGSKSRKKSKNTDYQVIDAIISSPVSLRLPDVYLRKYNVSPPLSPSSPLPSISPLITLNTNATVTTTTTTSISKDSNAFALDKHQRVLYLPKIINELQSHHENAAKTSLSTISSKPKTTTDSKQSVTVNAQSVPIRNEIESQQRLSEQQDQRIPSRQGDKNPQSEPIKSRLVYRYMDEQGRILKVSSVPPNELHEQPSQSNSYHNREPMYFQGQHITIDDDIRHPISQYEQRVTWQDEPKVPTKVRREDFELRDKRVPQLGEQSMSATRTKPVSIESEHSSRNSSQQLSQRIYDYSNQPNVKLAWLPLSYETEQTIQSGGSGSAGYDTDSTISEHSATHRLYEYGPIEGTYRYANRPYYHDYYYNHSSGPIYRRTPPLVLYNDRSISPEYGGLSRNYIEVFRDGDFCETRPSEIYSLPLSDHIHTLPNLLSNNHHSRYDQYQSERYGTMSNRNYIPSLYQYDYYPSSMPNSHYQQTIPSSSVLTPSYYIHRDPHYHRTVQSCPKTERKNYIRQSKSLNYRPLRTRLQQEYKITPSLLVDEWDYPQTSDTIKYSTTNRNSVSSPDDVFINS